MAILNDSDKGRRGRKHWLSQSQSWGLHGYQESWLSEAETLNQMNTAVSNQLYFYD